MEINGSFQLDDMFGVFFSSSMNSVLRLALILQDSNLMKREISNMDPRALSKEI